MVSLIRWMRAVKDEIAKVEDVEDGSSSRPMIDFWRIVSSSRGANPLLADEVDGRFYNLIHIQAGGAILLPSRSEGLR